MKGIFLPTYELFFFLTSKMFKGYFLLSVLSWSQIRIKRAGGSASAARKTAGSGSAKMMADPQP